MDESNNKESEQPLQDAKDDPAQEEESEPSFTPEELATMGTPDQKGIISNYPSQTPEAKLKIPYIEKMNGALCIKCMKGESEEELKKGYGIAIAYYNKALLSLKILFESKESIVKDQETAVRLITDIEIPCALNLALCYWKTKQYHYGIKYASQVIDKGLPEKMNAK